ncbi:MAG TPA: hypothetical protein GXZ96_00440 [Firmicutes bacterium]|jgi:hypothetical protein|nr:hypothetical protein [Bacillota bacterium]
MENRLQSAADITVAWLKALGEAEDETLDFLKNPDNIIDFLRKVSRALEEIEKGDKEPDNPSEIIAQDGEDAEESIESQVETPSAEVIDLCTMEQDFSPEE